MMIAGDDRTPEHKGLERYTEGLETRIKDLEANNAWLKESLERAIRALEYIWHDGVPLHPSTATDHAAIVLADLRMRARREKEKA